MMYICADIVPRRLLLEIHCYTCVQSFYLLENKLGYFRLTKELENNKIKCILARIPLISLESINIKHGAGIGQHDIQRVEIEFGIKLLSA